MSSDCTVRTRNEAQVGKHNIVLYCKSFLIANPDYLPIRNQLVQKSELLRVFNVIVKSSVASSDCTLRLKMQLWYIDVSFTAFLTI